VTPEGVLHDHGDQVFRHALELLGSEADAEDVTRDVLLSVMRQAQPFPGDSTVAGWLYRITVNAALAFRHRRAAWMDLQPADVTGADCHGQGSGLSELLEQAIAALPEDCREPLVLSDVELLSNAEIAGRLGLSPADVTGLLHRARTLVRDALAPSMRLPTRPRS
jgi:RNA polymerase sigma-70 factor (ECF subfamily)